jgi:D-alanine-D-alanine ligase
MNSRPVLLFGGLSRERLVSVASAQTLATVLRDPSCWFWRPDGSVVEVELDSLMNHEDPFRTPFEGTGREVGSDLPGACDELRDTGTVVVIGLHGGEGENGTVAGWLEERRIPFTGSSSIAGRLAFDKVAAKEKVAAAGVTVAESETIGGGDERSRALLLGLLSRFGRVVVKPVEEGSSYGLQTFSSEEEAGHFINEINGGEYERYIAERFLDGTELTCGVIDHNGDLLPLPTVEIRPEAGRSFDYAGKYLGEGVREICPAEVSEEIEIATREAARIAHEVLDCYGYSRSDFVVENGTPYFLETNTLPGLTKTSLLPQELREAGLDLRTFLDHQIDLARQRYN